MRCSDRCSPVLPRSPTSAPTGCNNPANPLSYSQMGPIMASALDVFAHASAPRGKPRIRPDRAVVEGEEVEVVEEVVLRKPFGQLKRFRRVRGDGSEVTGQPRLLHGRAHVRPLCDPAARHGRADAAGPRRLHHRLARREAGAARRRSLRPRRLCRLSDRVSRAYRPGRAHARRLPAVGAGLCGRRPDERGQASLPAEDADDDGRADRHAGWRRPRSTPSPPSARSNGSSAT